MRFNFRHALLMSASVALMTSAHPSFAADSTDAQIKKLQAQLQTLQNEITQLQTDQKTTKTEVATVEEAQKTPSTVGTGSFPGSFKIPGTETSVKIGGYVKLDAIEDAGSSYGASYAKFYGIPLNNDPKAQQSAQTTLNAQQTRVNFETRTPTSLGELKTFVEGDFYGADGANANTNGYGFELRHAYGALGSTANGQLLAGQTWSNFQDVPAMAESLDYVGAAGNIFVRQAQVRYTRDVGAVQLSGSVEAPIGSGTSTQKAITTTGGATQNGRGVIPDFVVRGDYKYDGNNYTSLRFLANQINVDHTSGTSSYTNTKGGWGVALSGVQTTFDKDNVNYNFVTGKGTGRYILDINAAGNYYNTTTNQLDLQAYYASTIGYQHFWSSQFRSNLFGGFVRNVNDTTYSGTAVNKYVASAHANLIWQPATAYKVGLEYMRGYRKVENGEEGNLNRVQASFIYGF